jgi:hypothetical protein
MQISGVSLALTWPGRLCLLRVLCVIHSYKLSPFQAHWGKWHCTHFLWPAIYLQLTWEVGLPPSPVEFSSHHRFYKISHSWLLGGAAAPASWHVCLQLTGVGLLPSPVEFSSLRHSHKLSRSWLLGTHSAPTEPLQPGPAYLLTVLGMIPLPSSSALSVPTLFAMCLYCSYCLLLSFSFFPWWRSVCPGGYAVLAQGCLWEYCVLLNSACPCLPKPSGHRLLVARGPLGFSI